MGENDLIREILLTRYRKNSSEERRFLRLVDSIRPPISTNLVRTLFQTFVDIEDFCTQETVIGKLCEANVDDYFSALSEELPRIIAENPYAAEDIIIRGAIEYPDEMLSSIVKSDTHSLGVICDFISARYSPAYPELGRLLSHAEAERRSSKLRTR